MEETTRSKPTLEDVAKYCGVSIATVSRVINQSSPVSKDLELRVRKAIKELGFTPRQWKDFAATKTIILIIPDILNPYYAEIVNAAQEEADRQGMALVILDVSENPELQKQHLSILANWLFDGLIVAGTSIPSAIFEHIHTQYSVPIVISRSLETPSFPSINPDYKTSTYQAAKYLLSLNHTRIAFISGPPDWTASKVRLNSVETALDEAGLTLPAPLYRWCYPSIEEGAQITRELVSLPPEQRPTAILAFNDLIAIGALRAIHTCGLQVPRDISVIGYDDIEMAAYTIPSLTTIAQPAYRIGQLAIKKICDILEGGVEMNGSSVYLECPLILRESTGVCPTDAT